MKEKMRFEGLYTGLLKKNAARVYGALVWEECDGKNFVKEDEQVRAWIIDDNNPSRVRSLCDTFAEFRGHEVVPETICSYLGIDCEYFDDNNSKCTQYLFDHDVVLIKDYDGKNVFAEIISDKVNGVQLIDVNTYLPINPLLRKELIKSKKGKTIIRGKKIGNCFDNFSMDDAEYVYQLHAVSGEYEDYHDRIIGTYAKMEVAEKEKIRLELIEAENAKCDSCVLFFCEENCDGDCGKCHEPENLISKTKKYCDKFEMKKYEGSDVIHCKNKAFHPDEITYRIEKVKIIKQGEY